MRYVEVIAVIAHFLATYSASMGHPSRVKSEALGNMGTNPL